MRTTTILILVACLLAPSVARAIPPAIDVQATTTSPSRAYLDFATNIAYDYNSHTGALTPNASASTTRTLYARAEAYGPGAAPSADMLDTSGPCGTQYSACGSVLVAAALIQSAKVWYEVHDNCFGTLGVGTIATAQTTFYYQGRGALGGSECGGLFDVYVQVNGNVVAYAEYDY